MIISHTHKFIFFAAGKTGTTSIESTLKPFGERQKLTPEEYQLYSKHMPPAVLKERLAPEIFDGYFKIAFVRNPWDWVVSRILFFEKWRRRRWAFFKKSSVHAPLTEAAIRSSFREHAPHFRGLTWVDSVYQHARLADRDGLLLPDYIGRFETMQEDFDVICDRIGIPRKKLPKRNRTAHRHYENYYDDATRELVAEKYRRDIRVFGYDSHGLLEPDKVVRESPFPT